VFAKLTFDEEFIDRRQQQKAAPPRFGSKFTGFAKVRLKLKLEKPFIFVWFSLTNRMSFKE